MTLQLACLFKLIKPNCIHPFYGIASRGLCVLHPSKRTMKKRISQGVNDKNHVYLTLVFKKERIFPGCCIFYSANTDSRLS